MTAEQCKKFMDAIKGAEIKVYEFDTDLGTHLYNDGVNAVAIPNHDLNAVIAFRSNKFNGSHGVYTSNVQTVVSDYGDIHEIRTAGSSEQIIKFAKAMGLSLTDDQVKIIVNIDKANYDIKPETGNYLGFHFLTQKQYDELSDEEKEKYDSEKAKYEEEKAKYIGQNMAARITL